MYHKIIIVGYLGRDPEMKYTSDGKPVTTFSVATSDYNKNTAWFRVTAWQRLAEICNEYLAKGRPVLVEGMLQFDTATGGPNVWTGKDGQARASFEITARVVKFLRRGGDDSGSRDSGKRYETAGPDVGDGDIPF